jgi:hypothetical protein
MVTFLGGLIEYRVQVKDTTLIARTLSTVPFTVGTEVEIGWNHDYVSAFQASSNRVETARPSSK